jgi:hypothetical protein
VSSLIALQRAIGNRRTARLLRQPRDRQPGRVQPPRRDYVFIMGADRRGDRNRFYASALRYYRAHHPDATFVTHLRNLADLFDWVVNNVDDPIGRLFIVSHANEDGTLSFGLDAADEDRHLDLRELRRAVRPQAGQPGLPRLGHRVDGLTRIHIKGCDIGRTQGMVELVDEAFGGAGTVTAPTHEQVYGFDPTLAERGRRRFRASVEARHPLPPTVDPALRGAARTRAVRERRRALNERQRAIQAELRARRDEERAAAESAGTYEALSGPMFQRPGTRVFTAAELRPEVDRLYSHLSPAQRRALVQRLVRADPRTSARAHQQGTFRQQGQRAYRYKPFSFRFADPRNVQEATRLMGRDFRQANFVPRSVRVLREPEAGGFRTRIVVNGQVRERGERPRNETFNFRSDDIVPDDATIIAQGREQVSNPDRYAWRVEERHSRDGQTARVAVAERVVAYLHHGSLDRSRHEHFTRPLADRDFFAESVFAPPRAPRRRAGAGGGP